MQKVKTTIQNWVKEAGEQVCACRDRKQGFDAEVNALAARALENILALPESRFDAAGANGLFGEKISLWRETGARDFVERKRPQACPGLPRDFCCDIEGLDVQQVLVYNGCVAGARGKNLLYPDQAAELGNKPCVCRLSDLEATPSHRAKLAPFFEAAEKGLHTEKKHVSVRSTADFAQGGPDLGREEQKWLNRALSEDTLLIYLPEGCRLEKPLQIVSLNHSEKPVFVATHCWILLEKGASMHLVQCTDSHPQAEVFADGLVEMRLAADAELEYIRMQNVGDRCKVFHQLDAHLERASRLVTHFMTLNGGLTQNKVEINLTEPEARADVFGLYLQDKKQQVSNDIKINHTAPRTYSRELFKGVLDDAAQAYFKGHVFVHPQALQTEAYQNNRNLLVSPKAQANAKPYLEIYADDVQCNHGVTVGQLDEDALFYMRCRGIPADAARRLLMRAYADEILKEVGVEALRGWLDSLVKKRFNGQLQACQDCVLACNGICG